MTLTMSVNIVAAMLGNMVVVTADRRFPKYGIPVLS